MGDGPTTKETGAETAKPVAKVKVGVTCLDLFAHRVICGLMKGFKGCSYVIRDTHRGCMNCIS